MARAPIGQRIRKRRQEVDLSQVALAARVDISPSYLNLIEHNKRAIGGALLNRIAEALELDSRALAGTEEARLIAELGEVAADSALAGVDLNSQEVNEIVGGAPKAARAILALFRAYQETRIRSDLISELRGEETFLAEASQQILALITTIRSYSEILEDYGDLSDDERGRFVRTLVDESERLAGEAGGLFDFLSGRGSRRPRPSPREEIEDIISDHANYFPALETAAAQTVSRLDGSESTVERLVSELNLRHGVTVSREPVDHPSGDRYDAVDKHYTLADILGRGTVRFRLARLFGQLEFHDTLAKLIDAENVSSAESARQLNRALASYFAAALIMPYDAFKRVAEQSRHDILRLGARFDAGFEQVCHRLVTLRRPGAEGVAMHFLRTDIAGNISKRFSASGLRLPRYGGACPRWIIHRAFASPGRIIPQVATTPDDETYLFITSTCTPSLHQIHAASHHAVMIGVGIANARQFVYADDLDLDDLAHAVPVGVTCRQCPRDGCQQRAFERLPVPGLPAAMAP